MGEVSRFGRRLRAFRERAGYTQTELAELSGVQRMSIVYVENGRQASLSVENTMRIADVLGITIDNLVRGDPLAEEQTMAAHA
jgi:transcriptional regulator with XRE-family HTH domain